MNDGLQIEDREEGGKCYPWEGTFGMGGRVDNPQADSWDMGNQQEGGLGKGLEGKKTACQWGGQKGWEEDCCPHV